MRPTPDGALRQGQLSAPPTASLREVIRLCQQGGGAVAIVEGERQVGLIGDAEVLAALGGQGAETA